MSPLAFTTIWPAILALLASVLLFSGVDDLIPFFIFLWHVWTRRTEEDSKTREESSKDERRIAIFVPCWKEEDVIESMVRHNLAAIRYRNYDFFLGAYPNDEGTTEVAAKLSLVFTNVHVAACPHPGPTSKADCLNWIYQRMRLFEQEHDAAFDTIVLHDAEDIIHPDALHIIHRERAAHAMVQVPVLPLATPFREFTHGVYCDEFAEYQTIDMRARQISGSFIPSNGVGTGFSRQVLDELARERNNLVFDPASLTEDYEIGVHIHQRGYSQFFAPLAKGERGFAATREYFPRKVHSAIRQRTRWVSGIALQCWENTGWSGSLCTRYWFWRDRKGLAANPLSMITNLLFTAGLADLGESVVQHRPWLFAVGNPKIAALCCLTLFLQCFRLGARMICVARIFGAGFALGVPLRTFHANFVNCCASLSAIARFVRAKLRREPLAWLKTDHAYPSRDSLTGRRRDLGEILTSAGYISEDNLLRLRAEAQSDEGFAELLIERGILSDDELCQMLSLQAGVPAGEVSPEQVNIRVIRSLPAHIEKRFGVLPVELRSGRLKLAGIRVPPSNLLEELKSFTRLTIDVQLVTRKNYEALRALM